MTERKYGNLLDKYINGGNKDYNRLLDKEQKEYTEKTNGKYGDLLKNAKPDYHILDVMAKIENNRIERRKQEERDRELEEQRISERIEKERHKEQEHIENTRKFAESIIVKKESKIKAIEMKREEKCRIERKEQQLYDNIDEDQSKHC